MSEKTLLQESTNPKLDIKLILTWTIPIILALLVYVLMAPLEESIRIFSALTIWAVFSWVFEILPEALVATMLVILYILAGIAKPAQVFAPWLSTIPWIVFGGLILSMAMKKTGLAKRIAYKIIAVTGTSFVGMLMGLGVIGIILTPLVSSPSARILLMAPIVIGIFQALDIKPGSKAGTALMLGVFYAAWSPNFLFITSSEGVMAVEAVKNVTGETLTFTGYLIHMSLIAVLWTFVSLFTLFIIRPGKLQVSKETLDNNLKSLGKTTREEKCSALLFILMLVLFLTDTLHKINPAWIIVLISSFMFFPGLNILEKEDLSKVNFLILFFVTGAMGIGEAAKACGATDLFTEMVIPFLQGQSSSFVILATWLISLLANFLLTPVAIMGSLFGPIVEIFNTLGINPYIGPYSTILGFSHLLFPYEMAPALIVYSFGYIKLWDMVKLGFFRMLVGVGFMLIVVIPYWKLINLL
ncbi:MAG: SLC13 family permease [Peptococcales bacterium]|jgi:anion transporter